jgi:hypothetical protein
MMESPVLQEFLAEQTREAILRAKRQAKRQSILQVLGARFGQDALAVRTALDAVEDDGTLDELTKQSATCQDLAGFKQELPSTESFERELSSPE